MHPLSAWIGVIGLAFSFFLQTIALAFWLGRVSQRLNTVEKASEEGSGVMEKVIRLEVQMDHANQALTKVGREMEGVNRQLGNIAMGHVGALSEIPGKKS